MAIRVVESVFYSHSYLWVAAENCLDRAKIDDGTDQDYLLTYAFLGSFLAFEAFLNFVGEAVDSVTWRHFGTSRVETKLKWICEKVNVTLDKNNDPYRSWRTSLLHRNAIAHGKVFRDTKEIDSEELFEPRDYIRSEWHEVLTQRDVERVRNQLFTLAELIRRGACDRYLKSEPLLGEFAFLTLGSVTSEVVQRKSEK